MWFRAKQEALKSGWLYKKGGGMSTLSRRNWKRRWFVLREAKLMYFENDSEEKLKGTIDIRKAKYGQCYYVSPFKENKAQPFNQTHYFTSLYTVGRKRTEFSAAWSLEK